MIKKSLSIVFAALLSLGLSASISSVKAAEFISIGTGGPTGVYLSLIHI